MVGTLLGALFFVNYGFTFESSVIRSLPFPAGHAGFYFLFYFAPYALTHAVYAFATRDFSIVRRKEFWILSLFAFIILAIYVTLHNGPWYLLKTQPSLFEGLPREYQPFAARCASNILPLTLMSIPLIAYWWKADRKAMPLYGFSAKTIILRSYFVILLMLVPIVIAASFTPDFQYAYPRYKFGFPEFAGAGQRRAFLGLYEFCYGADFVFVEFFFRGFMILAFARLFGPKVIIPMVVAYAMIHFEKPLLEALSSILGGLVLGIISYRTKSIYGGVIIHLGIAYTMEIAGALQM